MSVPDPRGIAEEILSSKKPVFEVTEEILAYLEAHHGHLGELEMAEVAEKLTAHVQRNIDRAIDSLSQSGATPPYERSEGSAMRYIRFKSAKEEAVSLAQKMELRDEILDTMRTMHWRKFEVLCGHVLDLIGAHSILAQGRRDGGVDFYGVLPLTSGLPPGTDFFRGVTLRIAGQAKRRKIPHKVTANEVKVFAEDVRDLESGVGRIAKIAPSSFLEDKGPILPIFATTTDFERGAKKKAERKGIVLRNGYQLVETILRFEKNSPWLLPDGEGSFLFDNKQFLDFFSAE